MTTNKEGKRDCPQKDKTKVIDTLMSLAERASNETEFFDLQEKFDKLYGHYFVAGYLKKVMKKLLERVCAPKWLHELPTDWTNNASEVI